jgi:hypothetical protein
MAIHEMFREIKVLNVIHAFNPIVLIENRVSLLPDNFIASHMVSKFTIFMKEEIHCRVSKIQPLESILSEMNSHTSKTYFSMFYLVLSCHLLLGLPSGFLPS